MAANHPALILRDGTTVRVRLCAPEDAEALNAFLRRIEAQAGGDDTLRERVGDSVTVEDLCDCSMPETRLTLIALRAVDGEARVVGSAGYLVTGDGSVDVGFGVDDQCSRLLQLLLPTANYARECPLLAKHSQEI